MPMLFNLFLSFCRIGFTSFGGMSMIPLINSEMVGHGWMTADEVADIVAIAEMTPGPIGLNSATFAGMRVAGIIGAIIANLGVLSPTLTICALASVFFIKFKDSAVMKRIMTGVRPSCLGMIFGIMITLGAQNYLPGGVISIPAILIAGLTLFVLLVFKWSMPKAIVLAAVLGLILC